MKLQGRRAKSLSVLAHESSGLGCGLRCFDDHHRDHADVRIASGSAMPAANLNRRAVLGGIVATTALTAATTAIGAEHPDAELLRLDKEMEAVHARIEAAGEVCSEISERTGGGICPESKAAEDVFSSICDEHWKIGQRIFKTPADTPEGMAVKLRAGDRMLHADYLDEREDFISIAADIRRLAGESAS